MKKHSKILPFDMKIVFAFIILSVVLFTVALFMGYIGDSFKTVPADERSYPQPKTN